MAMERAADADSDAETAPLLAPIPRRHSTLIFMQESSYDADIESLLASQVPKDELALSSSFVGERLPYNDYTTIDWLHDLVKDNVRRGDIHAADHTPTAWRTIRHRAVAWWDSAQGWVAAFLIGLLTAGVAFAVDVSVATVSDWKHGYCAQNALLNRRACCMHDESECPGWRPWADTFGASYTVYVLFALLFGIIAGGVTMTTKANLPAVGRDEAAEGDDADPLLYTETASGKTMYMAAGSGIPEIKTILSGFVIPHFLDLKVLVVKAVGATFAVATGMCLGKEGPFVHISTCVGYLVAARFPQYASNEAQMREMLAVACAAGLSVAFGAPIGGVLFSFEEIATYFPRRVLWRAFLCSFVAAAALRELNPSGTGKLVLFETHYGGAGYDFAHYAVFILLGACGGLFGGVFCQANFRWAKFFRQLPLIKKSPVLELAIVTLATAVLQYPNPLIRTPGDVVMEELLVDCDESKATSWICQQEANPDGRGAYYGWLISGTLVKLLLTIITFGTKVPSGVIIPALDAGALFGRLVGQAIPGVSPGIFAMVGAAAFLAGVSRMTVSLAVVMFELTGEVNFIPPFMVAILTAKWVADSVSLDGVYDLSQHLLGHPFLDSEQALARVRSLRSSQGPARVEVLLPPASTMEEITVTTGADYQVAKSTLKAKLGRLRARGLMDAGLVLVNEHGICHGYLPEAELDFALQLLDKAEGEEDGFGSGTVDLLHGVISDFIDRSPLTVSAKAPLEYAVEMFGKLGLRYLIVVEEDTAQVVGVVIKKRLVSYLDGLR